MRKEKKLLLAPDTLFFKTPDNKYWSDTIYDYSFFERYMMVFKHIVIISRCKAASYEDVKGYLRSDGPNIEIREIPAMQGMMAYIKNIIPFYKKTEKACEGVDCAIIRLPSIPASMVFHHFKKKKLPYAIEVVADPYDAYKSNILARYAFTLQMKKACLQANGVSYVTKYYLQEKYPSYCRQHKKVDGFHFEEYYSTIRLNKSYFAKPRNFDKKKKFVIIHTANNMNNDVKGHEILIQSAKKVINAGYDISVVFVGDGLLRERYEKLVKTLGLKNNITFVGMLSGSDKVRAELVKADILVFPTKAEGLPRTVIEAMAVGLPCISTPVAGIPELLDNDDLIEPDDVDGFARRIIEYITNTDLMNKKSKRNIIVASEYAEEILCKRRNSFYDKLWQIS